ncbi:ATP synthase mitochondrial f1 complex assembly factor 1 [Citrus sinensis]|uniref:ATP synthase mitochondrial f1 complex assembly factor 1 n=1 Tax=Citrus sinensis TaxID=2711 RepID=A0ACB8NI17_CITSI|nr:ATP synthase mitochondrial f1 complex assembly factor 1 [Citrus sinensis]
MDSVVLQLCYDGWWETLADGRMEYVNNNNTTFLIRKECTFDQFLARVYDVLQINRNKYNIIMKTTLRANVSVLDSEEEVLPQTLSLQQRYSPLHDYNDTINDNGITLADVEAEALPQTLSLEQRYSPFYNNEFRSNDDPIDDIGNTTVDNVCMKPYNNTTNNHFNSSVHNVGVGPSHIPTNVDDEDQNSIPINNIASQSIILQIFYFNDIRDFGGISVVERDSGEIAADDGLRFGSLWCFRLREKAIPCDFLKWSSLGLYRTSRFATGFTPLQPKPLDSIIDIERAKDKSAEDLATIWDDYHLGRGHICASLKTQLYRLLEHRSADCRYFVIPLWKGSGYATMFVQGLLSDESRRSYMLLFIQLPHILVTGLEDYKARGTQAAPYFTASFYTDFAESKDLVLIRGDIVFTSKLTDSEAEWLLETIQSFYLNDVRFKLVERFNKEARNFEFKDVLRALSMPLL